MTSPLKPTRKCDLCKEADAIEKERFCKACKKIVIDKAKAEGKVLEYVPVAIRERLGRTVLDNAALGGAADDRAARGGDA